MIFITQKFMNKIFQTPSQKANIGYSGFPMDNLLKFSSSVGELLPVYYDVLQPGDKVTCDYQLKTRTMELASAAMMSITEHVDWFFVPITQLYSIFGDWFNDIQDFKTSLVDVSGSRSHGIPYFSAAEFDKVLSIVATLPDNIGMGLTNTDSLGTGFRLMDLLGIPASYLYENADDAADSSGFPVNNLQTAICPLLFCAYQKIWFDYYRLSDRTANDPRAYNLDQFYTSGSITWDNYQESVSQMFSLRYRPWKRNFYTSLYTSPLFGSKSLGAFDPSSNDDYYIQAFQQWVVNSPNHTLLPDSVNPTSVQSDVRFGVTSDFRADLKAVTSPTSIRTSFAVQKLLEVTRRAGKHVDDQTLAHFGIKPPSGISGEVMFLGHNSSVINIGDVISTAATSDAELGQIGGKGYGFGKGSKIKFTAPCHGILMALYSAEPEMDFTAVGLDKFNLLFNRSDWPSPEFDNLGMQPLFLYQADYPTICKNPNSTPISTQLGWQHRWSEWKTKYNRVTGSLARSLAYWSPQTIFNTNNVRGFYVDPHYLNDVMLVNYEFDASELREGLDPYRTDPLIHEMYLDVQKASKMSTYGLESL